MEVYRSKCKSIAGTSHSEVLRTARFEYHKIQKRNPRRQANIRSNYFHRDKIFVNQFWRHIESKRPGDQLRRLKLFNCAIDLLRNTTVTPETIFSKEEKDVIKHRFFGISKDGVKFVVQVKENKRTDRKDFMSAFPAKKHK